MTLPSHFKLIFGDLGENGRRVFLFVASLVCVIWMVASVLAFLSTPSIGQPIGWLLFLAISAIPFFLAIIAWQRIPSPAPKIAISALLIALTVFANGWRFFVLHQIWETFRIVRTPSTQAGELNAIYERPFNQNFRYVLDNEIAGHQNCPPELMWRLFEKGRIGNLIALAQNPNTPEELISKLRQQGDQFIDEAIRFRAHRMANP